MTVVTKPPDGIKLTAETADEIELLAAITFAIRDGGTVEVIGVTALEFDGVAKTKKQLKSKGAKRGKTSRP